MAQSRNELLGTIVADAINTLAVMPEPLFETKLVCKMIIITPEFSELVDRKIEEARLEALEIVKAKWGKIYDIGSTAAEPKS